MDEKTVDRIFAGCLNDLPPVSSKIVRIFTSSTFTDMLMERNTLMEYVYPKIKEYCREKHGLEFQVKNSLLLGVRDFGLSAYDSNIDGRIKHFYNPYPFKFFKGCGYALGSQR